MELKSLIDTVAPSPYGWVITTQNDFDVRTMLQFQKQLLSLSRVLGPVRQVVHAAEESLVRA
jgi:hypothetical protein